MKAIINAHILGENGTKDGAILIKDGKIEQITTTEAVTLRDGIETIDAEGRYVTAGLIEAHTHLGIHEEGVRWEGHDYNETTSAITPQVRALDGIYSFDSGFIDALAGGVTAAHVLPGSANVIGGLTTVIKVKPNKVVDELILRDPAGLKVALGENPKGAHGNNGRAPKTRMMVAAMLREQFSKALHYIEKKKAGEKVFDFQLEAIQPALEKKIPVRAHAHRSDDIMTIIRIAKEFDLDLSIEHTTEGHQIARHVAESGYWSTVGPTMSGKSKIELRDKGWETYVALANEGVAFSIITDHPVLPIQYLATTAGIAVEHGLDEDFALRAITKHPAQALGIADRTGSLEEGKDADIVIWTKHPLKEHGQAYRTLVDGEVVYQAEEAK